MSNIRNNELPFVAVRGPEEKIMAMGANEGYVYFTTDTKKIYLDANGEKLSMGGNTGIYYADVKFENVEDLEFSFEIDDIENNAMPNIGDLILNTDGCFYKVNEIDEKGVITASKLTIAGGSGGGGGGAVGGLSGIEFDLIYPQKNTTTAILAGRPFNIEFTFLAKDELGESTGSGQYELIINNVVKKSGTVKEGHNSISVGDLFNIVGDYEVALKCYGDIGGSTDVSRTRKFKVRTSLFTIDWPHLDTQIHNLSENFIMNWSVSVESSNKTSYITIDDKYDFESTSQKLTISAVELKELGIGHGTHKFDLYTKAYIGDSEEAVYSDHIIKNVMFYDDTVDEDPGYIINCNYFETHVSQFDTIIIPVMIYHPSNINDTATIQFKVNGVEKTPKTNCKNLTKYDFYYTPDISGFISLQFICGTAEKSFILDVTPLDMGVEEVSGHAFKFKATEFANNEEVKNWVFKDQKGETQNIQFSPDFDWVNGGLQSGIDDVGPYFKIQAGSYIELPYKMFDSDLKDTGANFKMIFKAHNCRDYDASVVDCLSLRTYTEEVDKSDENGDPIIDETTGETVKETVTKTIPIGLALNAQGGIIRSLSNLLEVRYCEDSYIEYEFDICKYGSKVEDQYLTVWLDGIPAGVTQLSSVDSFRQGDSINLKIGSDDCDVYLYMVKFYKKHLTSSEHLDNFIMDAPNSTMMIERFNRNNILIKDSHNNSYISPELLAEKNPDCNVFVYEIPHIPTSKNDVYYPDDPDANTKCCTFKLLKGGKNAIRSYEGVSLRAQGTSSMTYGISAYNLDAKFPEKWSINEYSIPVNYMNTKVNVASCEGANNALNQEWYNRYQPYKTQKRLQQREDGKKARDTMEFINGVVFIQDNNKTVDSSKATSNNIFKEIPGYVESPYPRMYSIGNMGNAKKNVDVFHGAGNKYECCVENADNNTSAQRMLIIGGHIPANGVEGEPGYTEEREIDINLPDNLFDERGFVKPGIDWGETYDPQTNQSFDNKTLWKNALINEGWFEFRYCIDEDDFKPNEDFSDYNAYLEELSNRFLRLVRWFARNNPASATNKPFEKAISLGDYTVKGVKATAYENYSAEEVLKGVTVTGGTFEKDTAEYRVLKMLHESEDYLILDSILYHYLFIERHTMVDNVAKNTFWNTEDGVHWELTKDYDNDTADGVDNSGDLKFDYGYEVMDNINHAEDGSAVFNARPSAWLHFAHGLMPLREKMYQTLEKKGAWKAQNYLTLFENWQNTIPEVCWIEDFNRKYFRPNNVYGDKSYLNRLANGKKTHQRKQYETYQEQYMNSEYKTSAGEGVLIQWRSKQPETASRVIIDGTEYYQIGGTVKMYADGYFTAAIASGAGEEAAINIHTRGRKGQEINFSKYQLTSFDDATCYVYSPNLYQEFTGVEGLYPEYFTAIAANKLRKLSIEPKDNNQKKMLKESLSVGQNIEELVLKDCIEAKFDLDFSKYPRLKKLDATGSAFTSFTIADGAPLNYFKINSPTALSMSNIRYLKKDSFDIQSYGRLSKLILNNIDYNDLSSKDILNNVNKSNILEYSLKNVNWKFTDSGEVQSNSIPLLDFLLEKGRTIGAYTDENGVEYSTKVEDSLTGVATITNEAYSGSDVLNLYTKYSLASNNDTTYPKLDLVFKDASNNSKLYTVTIKNGDGENKWVRKYSNFNSISNSDLTDSSLGAFNASEAIKKQPSPTQVFTFNNQWKYTIVNTNKTGVIKGSSAELYLDLSELTAIVGSSMSDVIVEPDYTSETRYYTIFFVDKDTEKLIYEIAAEYDSAFESIAPKVIPTKDDSALELTKTYRLKGYSAAKTSNTLINEEYWRVTENAILYPTFEEVSVYDIDYEPYLKFSDTAHTILTGYADNFQGGKIVIPAKVTRISEECFKKNDKIRKIFVEAGSVLSEIRSEAFSESTLEYFDFINCEKLKSIGQEVFRKCPLNAIDYDNYLQLPKQLEIIGKNAFNDGNGVMFKGSNNLKIIIPSSVTYLGPTAIANLNAAKNVEIQIGTNENRSRLQFGDLIGTKNTIFHRNDTNNGIAQIYFYSGVYKSISEILGDGRSVADVLCESKCEINISFVGVES